MSFNSILAQAVKEDMGRKRMSQVAYCREIGITIPTLGKVLKGLDVRSDTVQKLTRGLNLNPTTLEPMPTPAPAPAPTPAPQPVVESQPTPSRMTALEYGRQKFVSASVDGSDRPFAGLAQVLNGKAPEPIVEPKPQPAAEPTVAEIANLKGDNPLKAWLDVLKYRESAMVFIDGQNLAAATYVLKTRLDYAKLRNFLVANTRLVALNYYAASLPGRDAMRPLFDFLANNGYHVKLRESYEQMTGPGASSLKTNIDVEMAVDMALVPYQMGKIGHVIMFSGDGDFAYPLSRIRDRGIRTSVVGPGEAMTANRMRRYCDHYIDLTVLMQHVDLKHRKQPVEGAAA